MSSIVPRSRPCPGSNYDSSPRWLRIAFKSYSIAWTFTPRGPPTIPPGPKRISIRFPYGIGGANGISWWGSFIPEKGSNGWDSFIAEKGSNGWGGDSGLWKAGNPGGSLLTYLSGSKKLFPKRMLFIIDSRFGGILARCLRNSSGSCPLSPRIYRIDANYGGSSWASSFSKSWANMWSSFSFD